MIPTNELMKQALYNLQEALKQSRMDIDQDLVSYFSGQREVLPVESIARQFFGTSIFEYDAD